MATPQLSSHFIPDRVLELVGQLVWCNESYKHVLVMALAVSHNKNAFNAVPYILATGDKPNSGKSTAAFDIPLLLAHNIESIDKTTTQPGMNSLFLLRETPNTAWDDIGKIFGASGRNGATSPFLTQLVRSYKRKATTRMSRNGAPVNVSTYGMAFLNGLDDAVPGDLFTRCIHFRMTEAPEGVAANLRDAMDESVEADAAILKEALHAWSSSRTGQFKSFMKNKIRLIHPKLVNRRRQIWGPLFAAAHAAGGLWPRRIFEAFIEIALDANEKPHLVPEQMALLDSAGVLMRSKARTVFMSDLIAALRELPDGKYYNDVETEHLASRLLPKALGEPKKVSGTMIYGGYSGQKGHAAGWEAAVILEAAVELRNVLYPEPEMETDDPLEDAFAFTPAKSLQEVKAA